MRNLEFDSSAFEDLAWWVQNDRKKALRIIRRIQETQSGPRIDEAHRLVYQVLENTIRVLACRYHDE